MRIYTTKTTTITVSKEPLQCNLEIIIQQIMSFKYLAVEITSIKALQTEIKQQTNKKMTFFWPKMDGWITNGTQQDCLKSKRQLSIREDNSWRTTLNMATVTLQRKQAHDQNRRRRRRNVYTLSRV
jgi:hypothetical protein